MTDQLDILFITADQWRGECLSALGHPMVKTPNLDALAADGVLFKRHYANAVPCGPSRASLHTGMYLQNHRSGTNGTPLDARHTNWAKEAARIGYDPVLFGYTDTSQDPREEDPESPWLRTYEGPLPGIRPVCMMGTWPTPWTNWLKEEGYEVPEDIRFAYGTRTPGDDYEDGAPVPRPLIYPQEADDTSFLTNRLMDYIAETKGRFVAHLSLLRPHPPFVASEPWNAMYDPEAVPGFTRKEKPADEAEQHPWLEHQLGRKLYRAPGNERKLRRMKAVYYGLMSEVDAALGRVFDFLKASGRWNRTLIIFTSDHGEQMGDHWLLGKCGYFDASYRIPLIIRDPRKAADGARGSVVDRFTENVDIMPTMLELIGAEIPVQCDGASLRPFLEAREPTTWRREAHWEFDFRDPADDSAEKRLGLTMHQCTMNIIRDEKYKYVHFTKLPPLFFDLEKDPDEFVNRATDPDYLPLVLEYAQKLLSWRMNHDEQTLTHIAITDDGPVERRAAKY
ncbi:sulfatase [Parvibaculum lavamentivorans DS-1]|uniref:Sulfatase n=1 Tax=Parvibaculum lavamentivorans (strain DS-1 / DSM 13023 / NCIMB 13966) TaxID=402881 RepID=A7HW45_PARL1|nr:alkaline phosphatase family protein [Parvibaculum lavamentivorans]ABS64128.1 sulfatase [Parvibaculum lavamentivorans DS-1]